MSEQVTKPMKQYLLCLRIISEGDRPLYALIGSEKHLSLPGETLAAFTARMIGDIPEEDVFITHRILIDTPVQADEFNECVVTIH